MTQLQYELLLSNNLVWFRALPWRIGVLERLEGVDRDGWDPFGFVGSTSNATKYGRPTPAVCFLWLSSRSRTRTRTMEAQVGDTQGRTFRMVPSMALYGDLFPGNLEKRLTSSELLFYLVRLE